MKILDEGEQRNDTVLRRSSRIYEADLQAWQGS